jgi:uncharacterized spore protein YtfJ
VFADWLPIGGSGRDAASGRRRSPVGTYAPERADGASVAANRSQEVVMASEQPEGKSAITSALSRLDAVKDVLTVKRVFGDAYEVDGVTVIPVAAVRGGGGAGGGEGDSPVAQGTGAGGGVGFGVNVRAVGTVVISGGTVTWVPAVDVTRIVFGGQVVAIVGILVFGRILTHRRRHRH